ncbi:beta-ketoacyl-[acyl-carrier-protein] synthase family protein [Chitinivibrio alkaliphilus]|uniref:3-oxoacyl-(Acyl carrier protein) synthase II n=1 Tax=Chitinivibrio alkaliphilus ACht1 TaxID=1313304 RepID=U7D8B4_9BACT|nr:beta-ketoacyl-[acyl-carrier-protein] synthase family protein [Chitinivibrio alkaliphilus]ERP32183.1 3-oxoacyl-(acyl carrier protein) synthase II [Chitinivibrio alkaliphilus ACht1]
MNRRVVVTGLGVVTPIGTGREAFWEAAVKGTNGVLPITSFDTTEFRTKTGGEVRDFTATDHLPASAVTRMGRASQFAIAAAQMALDEAGLSPETIDPFRIGVSMGTTMGEPQIIEKCVELLCAADTHHDIPQGFAPQYPANVIQAHMSSYFNLRGASTMIPTACAAGNHAIGYAYDQIRTGSLDYVFAGGSDPFAKVAFTGFNRLLATTSDVCRPFDKERNGMAVSEGAGVLVLESLSSALERGAPIYGEVLGYGLGCDAHDMTIPHPEGEGGIRALSRAVENSGVAKEEVDLICAHGTGTPANDSAETRVSKHVFGELAQNIPMISLKSMLGHTMGAASAIEAAACCMMLQRKKILPTINYATADPDCDLDYVPNTARDADLRVIISNAYAFGGNTSAIVLKQYTEGA